MSGEQTLLIVDDDEMLRQQLTRAITARGLRVVSAANFDQAVEQLGELSPDLAVVDLRMPGESGLEVLREIKGRSPATKSIVLTGYGSIANAVEAMRLGAVNYVTKPADADQILQAFESDPSIDTTGLAALAKRPSLAEAEWNHIQKVLTDCDGNITHAAKILDIPRRTLQRKLKKRSP